MSTLAERRFVLDAESLPYHASRKNQHETVTWNEDVVTFEPPFAPELVLSISTQCAA